MAGWNLFIVLSVTFSAGESFQNQRNEKRILLSDPAVIENRLQEMERKFQTLESTLNTKLNAQEQEIQNLATRLTQLTNTDSGGAVYVRWGRQDCPNNDTELVYSGYAGGSHYTHEGAAAEYVCLPPDPLWGDHYNDVMSNTGGYMYGAEYEGAYFGSALHDDEVPCAVCRSMSRATYIMIPGKNKCYTGWTLEFSGNLATGQYTHKAASQYVCLDEHFIPIPHSSRNDNGKLFYGVEGVCGSLACPPYVNGRELTCVVCTK